MIEAFESRFVKTSGKALICGSNIYDTGKEDRRSRYEWCVGVDAISGNGVDFEWDLTDPTTPDVLGKFSHIDCLSVLEHCKKPWALARNMEEMLLDGGSILVSVPFVWRVHAYPSDYFRFTREGVMALFDKIEWLDVCYAGSAINRKNKIPHVVGDHGLPMFERTEVFAFGKRR